jgi:hypothetical protein
MFLAIDSTNAVFPIAGLAAMIIKSLGCHPEVNLSSLSKPVATPLKPLDRQFLQFFFWLVKLNFELFLNYA